MKNEAIPRLRFKGFSNEWNHTTIGQQADIVRGASPRPIKDPKWFDKNSDVGWLRISDVTSQNGRLHFIKQRISKLGEAKTRVLTTPHLILSIAATVGEPAINYVKTGVHDGFLIFNSPKFNLEYMFQWLLQFKPKWRKYGQPGSQVNLNSSIVSSQNIYIPSLPEQQLIGKFFAKLDKLIKLQQKKVALLKKLKRGYLQKLFPRKGELVPRLRFKGFHDKWGRKSLLDITNLYNGQSYKRHDKSVINKGTFVIRASNIQHGQIIHNNDDVYINSNVVNVNNIKPGDIIIVTNNGSRHLIGKHAMVTHVYPNTVIGAFMNAFRSKNNCYFINALLNSNEFLRDVHKSLGGIINNLSKSDFRLMFLTIPLLKEQVYIGNFFKKLDRGIILQRNKLAYLRKLKKAYLQKMFC